MEVKEASTMATSNRGPRSFLASPGHGDVRNEAVSPSLSNDYRVNNSWEQKPFWDKSGTKGSPQTGWPHSRHTMEVIRIVRDHALICLSGQTGAKSMERAGLY